MSTLKSIRSLGSVLSRAPRALQPKKLRRYSWLPDVLTIEGSIIKRVMGPVLTVTLFAVGVAVASQVYGKHVNMSNNVVPLLSVVVGLILVFRNGTSYDRYYEGRKDFGVMVAQCRNLSRSIWVQVNVPPPPPAHKLTSPPGGGLSTFLKPALQSSPTAASHHSTIPPSMKLRKEKTRALRLLISFAYSVMHHLRDEPGTDYEDYAGILPEGFNQFISVLGVDRTTMSNRFRTYMNDDASVTAPHNGHGAEGATPRTGGFVGGHSRAGVRSGHAEPAEHTALLSDDHTTVEFHPYSSTASMPLPLIIAHEINRQLYQWKRNGYLEPVGPAGFNAMCAGIAGMVEQMTHMERVATTPIPISYGIHLKQCVTLYLFTLPFTLIQDLNWKMVPVVTMVAFTLMGIEGIANEIEMPFGKDKSDLPLEKFCAAMKAEVDYIIERLPEGDGEDSDPFGDLDVSGMR